MVPYSYSSYFTINGTIPFRLRKFLCAICLETILSYEIPIEFSSYVVWPISICTSVYCLFCNTEALIILNLSGIYDIFKGLLIRAALLARLYQFYCFGHSGN